MSATSKPKVGGTARDAARMRFSHLADVPDGDPSLGSTDAENPSLSDNQLAALRPAVEVVPELVMASLRRRAGRPKGGVVKKAISLRLDPTILEAFKAMGSGWQTRMEEVLRDWIERRAGH